MILSSTAGWVRDGYIFQLAVVTTTSLYYSDRGFRLVMGSASLASITADGSETDTGGEWDNTETTTSSQRPATKSSSTSSAGREDRVAQIDLSVMLAEDDQEMSIEEEDDEMQQVVMTTSAAAASRDCLSMIKAGLQDSTARSSLEIDEEEASSPHRAPASAGDEQQQHQQQPAAAPVDHRASIRRWPGNENSSLFMHNTSASENRSTVEDETSRRPSTTSPKQRSRGSALALQLQTEVGALQIISSQTSSVTDHLFLEIAGIMG